MGSAGVGTEEVELATGWLRGRWRGSEGRFFAGGIVAAGVSRGSIAVI